MKKPLAKAKAKKQIVKPVVVAVSGGFDPVHVGHARMFAEAKKLGDKLVVILNNDNWLVQKKGYAFMSQDERAELIRHFEAVDEVVLTGHKKGTKDMSVVKELRKLKPHVFANGGDRKFGNVPEVPVCEKYGIKMVFNIGHGGKVQSSSWLLAAYMAQAECVCGAKRKDGTPRKYGECHGRATGRKQ